MFGYGLNISLTSVPPPLTLRRDLWVSGGPSWRWLRCEKGRKRPEWSGVHQGGGWRRSGGVAWGRVASSNKAVGGSPHSRCWPVVWWKLHVCWALCAGGAPTGCGWRGSAAVGNRQENVFRSPVILHNAGQIRLELTAEDIQLDCARQSVASIWAPARLSGFPVVEREKAAGSVFLCHFRLVPGFLH